MLIYFEGAALWAGLAALALWLAWLWRRGRRWGYLALAGLFGLYLLAVIGMVYFPLYLPPPGEAESLAPFRPSMNLRLFSWGGCFVTRLCVIQAAQNVLLTIPFGAGISLLARLRRGAWLWLAPLVGLALEGGQLALSLLLRSPLRVADVNDMLLNALGVWIGLGLVWAGRRLSGRG